MYQNKHIYTYSFALSPEEHQPSEPVTSQELIMPQDKARKILNARASRVKINLLTTTFLES